MTVAAFAEQLWPLTEELSKLYDEWLPRLRAAFGSWRRPSHRDALGEPDGYGGLSRRGLWERLVTTEWALAEAVPDEFIRRAAMKEQLFLELSRVVPAAAPLTRVWVDCGPSQLGGPRLAHLAILVVLRRRAEEAGGRLLWATLHAPETFHDELDPRFLLEQRTTTLPPGELVGEGERLVIGPAVEGARRISVTEVSDGLCVRFDGREVTLDLPEPPQVARLLRRPRAYQRHTVTYTGNIDAIRFVPGGGALLVGSEQRVLAFAVPDRDRSRTKLRGADWRTAGQLVGVGWTRQKLLSLRRIEDEAVLCIGARTDRMPWPAPFQIDRGLPWVQLLPRTYQGPPPQAPRRAVLTRDATGLLYVFDFDTDEFFPVGRSTSEVVTSDNVLIWFDGDTLHRRIPNGAHATEGIPTLRDYDHRQDHTEDFVDERVLTSQGGLWRAERCGDQWKMGQMGGFGTWKLPISFECVEQVVGVVRDLHQNALVVRVGHEVRLHTSGRSERIYDAADGLVHVAVGGRARRPLVASSTEREEIVICTTEGDEWLSFFPGEEL